MGSLPGLSYEKEALESTDADRLHPQRSHVCVLATQAEVPFVNLTTKPELRECFLKCKLPHQGLRLEHVTVESSDGQALAKWPVEVHGYTEP